jgi:hypothetical protein
MTQRLYRRWALETKKMQIIGKIIHNSGLVAVIICDEPDRVIRDALAGFRRAPVIALAVPMNTMESNGESIDE